VANVQDLLLKNPSFGTPPLSRTNSNFFTTSAGVANIDLLNLGADRTLVLVDGRRFVAGQPGGAAVDLNAIPAQFIERIDVLTGGASAIYGSDAVAGVVNFIYKKRFEGIEVDYQYGWSAENDNKETQFSVTMGTNTADGKGNLMAHIGYTDQGAVYARDRKETAVDMFYEAAFTGDEADALKARIPFYSSYAPQGRQFTANGPGAGYTTDAAGNVIPWSTNGTATLAATGFNRQAFRTIAVPVERYLFATRGSYEFADQQSVFMEGTYSSNQAKQLIEPFAMSSADIYDSTGGQVPIEFMYEGAMRVNPTLPSYIVNTAADEDGDGLRDYYFTRRLAEVGPRNYTADRDTFRAVVGIEGIIFDDWNYEAFYAYGATKEAQNGSGQINVLNVRYALEGVPDVTDVNGNGDFDEAVCRDAEARARGCVPVSFIGFDSITPEAYRYINAPTLLTSFTSQKLAGVNLTGDLIDLWAGPLGVAVGAEWRKEYSRDEFDALVQLGLNAGNARPPQEGEFDVTEGYVEANLPLLTDVPFANRLNLRAAYRYADYSTIGGADSWNMGVEWAPIPQLRFRAVRAQTTRAPNIGELYQPASETFPSNTDPCVGVTATSTTEFSERCRAAPGVAENIALNGAFTLNQADLQGTGGFNRGNPLLGEEQGKSWTFGAVITPDSIPVLENFTFSIDYYKVEIEDAIVSTPRAYILDQCYSSSGDASFCSFITRRPEAVGFYSPGSLDEIDSAVSNSGGLLAEGINLTVGYAQAFGPGQFSARLIYGHVLDGWTIPLPGADKDPFAGEVGASEDRANLSLGYQWGDFGVTWLVNYIGGACLDDQDWDVPPCVGSVLYNDMQATWSPGDRYELYLGASNVFDEKAPFIPTGIPENTTGTATDAGTYDPIGQRFYAGVRVKF
jgi:outer membrane receptor protein involved in Fe transport